MPDNFTDRRNGGDRRNSRRNKISNSNITRKIGNTTYSLVDIGNLKQANAEMSEIIKKQEEFIKLQERRLQAGKKVEQFDINIANAYKEQNKQLEAQIKNNEKIFKNWNRYANSTLQHRKDVNDITGTLIEKSQKNQRTNLPQMGGSVKDLPRNLQNILQYRMNARQEQDVNKVYEQITQKVVNKYKRQGADFTDAATVEKVNKEIQERTLKEIGDITNKYGKHTKTLEVATKIFSEAVNVWYNIASRGLSNQSNAYENTFTNIAVRNDVSRSNYYDAKWKLNNNLSAMGVRNNVASSDVQNMWNAMATSGVVVDMSTEEKRAEISARAIDNVITKTIVPYLDTSTAQWEQLLSVQPDLQKNIRGINQLNKDIVGNNYATADMLQTILDDLQPISDNALNDLAMSASGATAYINSLMEAGMDEATAKSMWTEYYKQQQYGAQILRSGSTSEKMALTNAMTSGINIYSSEDTGRALDNIARTKTTVAGWGPGYGNTVSGVTQSVVNDATGVSPALAMWADSKGANLDEILDLALSNSNEAIEKYKLYGNDVTNKFANEDKYQTNKRLQDITVENLMNELSVINDWLGNWAGVLKTAIEAIGTLILTKIVGGIIGKGISALSGISANGVSAVSKTGLVGTTAKTALGVAGIATAAAALVKIGDNLNSKLLGEQQQSANTNSYLFQEEMKEELKDTGLENNDAAVATRSAGEGYNAGKGNWETIFDRGNGDIASDWWADTKGLFGNWADKAWFFNNPSKKDAQAYNSWKLGMYLNENHSMTNNDDYMHLMLTYYALMASQGLDGNYTKNENVNDTNVKQYIKDVLADDKLFEKYGNALNTLQGEDIVNKYGIPIKDDWENTQKTITNWAQHRYGLDYVPYDEYPALLHEGEAVLTASTATTLRSLLDEYQQTSKQSVNFDVIIGNQTAELVAEMKNIITAIYSISANRIEVPNAGKQVLTNSAKQMKSSKNF